MSGETIIPKAETSKYLIPVHYDPREWENHILDKRNYTVQDYLNLPEGSPYQLVEGVLVMTPAPIVHHQRISRKLEVRLCVFVEKQKLGEVFDAPIDVCFDSENVFQPDIIFISQQNSRIINTERINGAPDFVVEILSPSTAYWDLKIKYRVYEKYGVKEYWIIDPKLKRVEIYINNNRKFILKEEMEERGTITSTVIQGFKLSAEDIF